MTYYERLEQANRRIGTTNIKGKEYAEVNQRILAFWELFPSGRIVTEKVSDDGVRCDFVCRVYADYSDTPAATGHAFEEKKGMINSTSYVENCETSAVGRALGMLGIGAVSALASKEEVENAIAQQEASKVEAEAKGDYMQPVRDWWPSFSAMFADSNEAMGNLLRNIGAHDMKSLTHEQADRAVAHMAQTYAERSAQ